MHSASSIPASSFSRPHLVSKAVGAWFGRRAVSVRAKMLPPKGGGFLFLAERKGDRSGSATPEPSRQTFSQQITKKRRNSRTASDLRSLRWLLFNSEDRTFEVKPVCRRQPARGRVEARASSRPRFGGGKGCVRSVDDAEVVPPSWAAAGAKREKMLPDLPNGSRIGYGAHTACSSVRHPVRLWAHLHFADALRAA